MASQLTFFAVGVAAENKSLTSRELMVAPTELTPGADGEVAFNPVTSSFTGVDHNGDPYEVVATQDHAIPAEWLPMGSNRVTPPDIRRGEPIALYRLADSERYYWRCMGLRDDLRRLETVIYAFNGNPEETTQTLDLENCYFFEVSTHSRTITMGTSQKNNEAVKYVAQFDPGKGKFTVEDDLGNFLHLDSTKIHWEMKNADGTSLRLDRKNIFMYAPDSIYGKAENLIRMDARNIQLHAREGILLKAGNQVYAEAPTITAKANTVNLDAGQTNVTGNLNVGGTLSVPTVNCETVNASSRVNAPNI